MNGSFRRTLLVSVLAVLPAAAQAGPPLICFPVPVGGARSLAWGSGSGWNTPSPDYDRARLAEDTVALLAPQAPVLVRMETLRRAAVYAASDPAAARKLFDALRARAASAHGAKTNPLAQFDLGYAVEAYRQTRYMPGRENGAGGRATVTDPPEDGYALVRQALSARGSDPEMEYAAALMTCDRPGRALSDKHLEIALAGAREGSDLARTMDAHRPLWGDRLQALRAAAR